MDFTLDSEQAALRDAVRGLLKGYDAEHRREVVAEEPGFDEKMWGRLAEMGADPLPVQPLPIARIAPGIRVRGPVVGLDEEVRALHLRFHAATAAGSAGPA